MDTKKIIHSSLRAVGYAGLGYLAVTGIFYLMQDTLLFQGPAPGDVRSNFSLDRFNRYSIDVGDDIINGWYIKSNNSEPKGVLIYFGGNTENIDSVLHMARKLNNVIIVAMHYRGYGLSTGKTSEQNLYSDALTIYDDISLKHPELPIGVLGRSLGSGVAAYLAAHRKIKVLGLLTPYDSIESVAKRHYRWLPIKFLLKHKFNSVLHTKNIKAKTYVVFAENDTLIPEIHAKTLFNTIPDNKYWLTLNNVGHSDIHTHPGYYPFLRQMIDDL